jgi:hypothetical protein
MRLAGLDVWAEWLAAGPEADDSWRDYEQSQGRSYTQALYEGDAASMCSSSTASILPLLTLPCW